MSMRRNMSDPLISVIVPVYNVEPYLDKCVQSIVDQTYRHIEIILVDDGSTDGSPVLCDKWKEIDGRVRVIHQANRGVSCARNTAIRSSAGEIIAFADPDDWLEPKMYETMLRRMQEDNSEIVICASRRVTENGDTLNVSKTIDGMMDTRTALSELIRQRYVKQTIWSKLYKKEVIESIQFAEGRSFEDVLWSYEAIANAGKISSVPDVLYNHFYREGSATTISYSARNLDALDGYRLSCELIKQRFPELYDDILLAYMGYCFNHLQDALLTHQNHEVIKNIVDRLPYRKTGDPTKKLNPKQKLLYFFSFHFPVFTSTLLNTFKCRKL